MPVFSHTMSLMKTTLTFIRLAALVGFISLCALYLGAKQPQLTAYFDCTGCPEGNQSSKGSCTQCHTFTRNVPFEGCTECSQLEGGGGGELAKIRAKRDAKGFVLVTAKQSGKLMKIVSDWKSIGLPPGHLEEARKARLSMTACKEKHPITQ